MQTSVQSTNNYAGTVRIMATEIDTLYKGFFYPVFRTGKRRYLYDSKGNKTFLVKKRIKWVETDNVVMIVKVTASLLDSVSVDKIYRVFNDTENDERYIFDEKNRKVLFDCTIFSYEIV